MVVFFQSCQGFDYLNSRTPYGDRSSLFHMLVKLVLRLALATVLNAKAGNFLTVIGLVCSSFVSISAGTHRRAPWDPYGQTHIPMVQMGNELAARKLVSTSWTWNAVLQGFEGINFPLAKNHWSLVIVHKLGHCWKRLQILTLLDVL